MLNRNVEGYKNIGLNADWCVSTYQLSNDIFIFDNEDDSYTLSRVDVDNAHPEEAYFNYCTGSFEECIEKYEELTR